MEKTVFEQELHNAIEVCKEKLRGDGNIRANWAGVENLILSGHRKSEGKADWVFDNLDL